MEKRYNLDGKKERTCVSSDWLMTDWLMDKYVSLSSLPQLDLLSLTVVCRNTKYVDCDGTLHVKLEMTLN
jgi:hypothetical protein